MGAHTAVEHHAGQTLLSQPPRSRIALALSRVTTLEGARAFFSDNLLAQFALVFLAYVVAGKLGQATTNIRSGNLGPVWPASGIALAGLLAYGFRAWPAVVAAAFVVAFQSPVPAITALGQAAGATAEAVAAAFLLRRIAGFDPALSRLRDAIAFVVAAFAGAIFSASIGIFSLYSTGLQSYSGLGPAWLIYWLGDATGALLVTPLIFTLPTLFAIRSRRRVIELIALLTVLTGTCFLVFGDLPIVSVRLEVLAFAILPFVMWAAINFGIGGASLSIFVIATAATLLTAMGLGPFSLNTPFVNASLLDVLFAVLAVSGLTLASVIAERERAEAERERLIRAQAAVETRLRLAAIVESSHDAILSTTLDGIILSWNAAAQRIFGFTEAEAVGQSTALLIPPAARDEDRAMLERLRAGDPVKPFESVRVTKAGKILNVAVTISPVRDAHDRLVGVAKILRDITEHKRAEEALASVSRRLIEAQEQERSRIARELHDDIGQRLAMLAINLTILSDGAAHEPDLQEQTLALHRKTSDIAADIQGLSHRLHSSRLELLGISAAMKHFCAEFADQQKATIDFTARDLPELPSDVSLSLFRILQEALHNSAKHSGTRQFGVRLWGAEDEIHLVVTDQGKGFDVQAARTGRGIGLLSMEERIKLVNGALSIESQPQHGTTIHARARVPVHSE